MTILKPQRTTLIQVEKFLQFDLQARLVVWPFRTAANNVAKIRTASGPFHTCRQRPMILLKALPCTERVRSLFPSEHCSPRAQRCVFLVLDKDSQLATLPCSRHRPSNA